LEWPNWSPTCAETQGLMPPEPMAMRARPASSQPRGASVARIVRYLPRKASAMIPPITGKKYALATNRCIHSRDSVSVMKSGRPALDIRCCIMKTTRIDFIP